MDSRSLLIAKLVVEVIAEGGFKTLLTMTVVARVASMVVAEKVILLVVKLLTASVLELYKMVELLWRVTEDGKVSVRVLRVVVGEKVMAQE